MKTINHQNHTIYGVDIADAMKIRTRRGYGVSVALAAGDEIETCCCGSGRYEQLNEDFRLDEVRMQDGNLYAKIITDDGEVTSQLYPIGERTFGRKGGFAAITFGDGCLTVNGITCKKR